MKQVEQMLKELEENSKKKIAIISGKVILEEDRPKYEALLRLQRFLDQNQSVFVELANKSAAAGVDVNSIVDSYSQEFEAPIIAPAVEDVRSTEETHVVEEKIEEPSVVVSESDEINRSGYVPYDSYRKNAEIQFADSQTDLNKIQVADKIVPTTSESLDPAAGVQPASTEDVAPIVNGSTPTTEVPMEPVTPAVQPNLVDELSPEEERVEVSSEPAAQKETQPAASDETVKMEYDVRISDYLDDLADDGIALTLQFPENEVALNQTLNSWIFDNIDYRLPHGYICYAKVNSLVSADIYMGNYPITYDYEANQKRFDAIKKDLLLYYDYSIADVSSFEQKHNISRLEQVTLPLNLYKKTISGAVPYASEDAKVPTSDVPSNEEVAPAPAEKLAAGTDKVPVEEAAAEVQESSVADTNELKIEDLIKPELLNALPILSGTTNRYLSHDTLRRWIEDFIDLPEGYIMYATVADINNATIYLGKKNQEETMELHALKSVPLELWEMRSNITRVDSKDCVLVPQREGQELRKEDIAPSAKAQAPEAFVPPVGEESSPSVEPTTLDTGLFSFADDEKTEEKLGYPFAGVAPEGQLPEFPSFGASLAQEDLPGETQTSSDDKHDALFDGKVDPTIAIDASYSAAADDEPQTTKVVGRRLTSWVSELSRSQIVRKGLSFLDLCFDRSEMYTKFMDELAFVDLNDEDVLIKLADIENRLDLESEDMKDDEVEKIRKKINKLIAAAQRNSSNGISRG